MDFTRLDSLAAAARRHVAETLHTLAQRAATDRHAAPIDPDALRRLADLTDALRSLGDLEESGWSRAHALWAFQDLRGNSDPLAVAIKLAAEAFLLGEDD